jgi:uncharacterized metal-binding protein YceD (DUF177 family)
MKPEIAPWSVPVRLADIGTGYSDRIEADDGVKTRVAKALGVPEIKRLAAHMKLEPTPDGAVLKGRVRSELSQTCGITLEPFPVDVDANFEVRLTTAPPAEIDAEDAEFGLADLDGPDYLPDGIADLGAYAVEHLALELDPFPRKPGVVFEQPEQAAEPSPFSVLANLKPKSGE